ncbi:hypothetical protein Ddye_012585 [Dipteronia dyeriana]|uniref:Uncharacterized protein n=1 Tax=Dipteronia dyeriana TaxID=168575 RepID=A0AAD9X4P6_9ROSI|nr:hypothetical protein Ddye_012585 [Dipteronia dyeriana]
MPPVPKALPRYQPRKVNSLVDILPQERGEFLHPMTSRREAQVREEESSDSKETEINSRKPESKLLRDQLAELQKEVQLMKKGKYKEDKKDPLSEMNAPFTRRIREAELLIKFKMSTDRFSGTEDPLSH